MVERDVELVREGGGEQGGALTAYCCSKKWGRGPASERGGPVGGSKDWLVGRVKLSPSLWAGAGSGDSADGGNWAGGHGAKGL